MTTTTTAQIKREIANNAPEHRAYWNTQQVCQRYGNITPRSLRRYPEKHGMPKPIECFGINLYSIPELLDWELKTFGQTVLPNNWDNPEALSVDECKQLQDKSSNPLLPA
ncbi:hypothetical protein [Pseudoalteromonas sp.]|uniref:hypothetical protein n=1 Tax=Pseudoalteromonas sp. TaxID=53249 RepID=UPI002729C56C|nr:hypothetical protein [Pseudoalteromonas sp.]